MTVKNPEAPASEKQTDFLLALIKERAGDVVAPILAQHAPEFPTVTKGEASAAITALLDTPKFKKGAPKAKAPAPTPVAPAANGPAPVAADGQLPLGSGLFGKKITVTVADGAAEYEVTAEGSEFVTLTWIPNDVDYKHSLLGDECRVTRANVASLVAMQEKYAKPATPASDTIPF